MTPFWNNINLGFLRYVKPQERFVAFDIGSSSIKMAEAAMDRAGWRLLNVGVTDLPQGAVQNNMVVEPQVVVEGLTRLIKQHRVKSTKVVSAVPGRAVIMKKFQLPTQQEEELEANIEFEASKVIPENLENVNLDYQVLGYAENGTKMEILLVAVRKEIVKSYTDVIEEAGLTPAVMDVDYFAMESMYETSYEPQAANELVPLIHIGAHYTSINVLGNGVSTFTGDLPIGGEEFTDTLSRHFDISHEAAETLKMSGLLNGKKVPELDTVLRAVSESLAEDIRRTLSLYGGVSADDGVRAVYLTGGGAKTRGLSDIIQEKFGVPVVTAEPARGFHVASSVDKGYLGESASQLAIGLGLAVRRPGDK
jgi:type IV pilus assembly protein PilM